MEKKNYDVIMNQIIEQNQKEGKVPTLLLHTCCAPCSSQTIARLSDFFHIAVFYYNPNIEPYEEYTKRKEEQIRFLKEYKSKYPISFFDCDWENEKFIEMSLGLEKEGEGGVRCHKCYYLRLEKTAQMAKEKNFDYFTTSLTISPYKDSQVLNRIGEVLEKENGVHYLYSDFKKQNGYQKSIEFSKDYGLYRQDYCGCKFSKEEREKTRNLVS